MGTFFELGKDKAAKGEVWAPPFISCAQDTVGLPTAPTAIRLWETFTFYFCKEVEITDGPTEAEDVEQRRQEAKLAE